jgi:hypothetical protein
LLHFCGASPQLGKDRNWGKIAGCWDRQHGELWEFRWSAVSPVGTILLAFSLDQRVLWPDKAYFSDSWSPKSPAIPSVIRDRFASVELFALTVTGAEVCSPQNVGSPEPRAEA